MSLTYTTIYDTQAQTYPRDTEVIRRLKRPFQAVPDHKMLSSTIFKPFRSDSLSCLSSTRRCHRCLASCGVVKTWRAWAAAQLVLFTVEMTRFSSEVEVPECSKRHHTRLRNSDWLPFLVLTGELQNSDHVAVDLGVSLSNTANPSIRGL